MTTPKKSLGQHWLFDSKSLGAMCEAADVTPEDVVLEIGPGLGPLTIELTQRAKKVVAVELDQQLARGLSARVAATNLEVINQDILKFDLTKLPKNYKVVANVPYYISSNLVRFLLESPTPPTVIVMLMQKEVAERLAATPGDMSILGISAQLYAHVNLGPVVTADKFDPPPKVDSQVVIMTRRKTPLFKNLDTKKFFRVVKAGFGEKRKTLRNSLSGGLHLTKTETEGVLRSAAVDPGARAEQLSLEDWHRITIAVDRGEA